MIVLICVVYYALAIIGIFVRLYFRQFTTMDFYSDKSLNRKRRVALVYHYGIFLLSALIIGATQQNMLQSTVLVWSATVILIIYIFFIDFLEVPSRRKKKK